MQNTYFLNQVFEGSQHNKLIVRLICYCKLCIFKKGRDILLNICIYFLTHMKPILHIPGASVRYLNEAPGYNSLPGISFFYS